MYKWYEIIINAPVSQHLANMGYLTELNTCKHLQQINKILQSKNEYYIAIYLHPMSMTQILKIFSEFVFGDTLPKPTLVRLEKVK